jgi:signal peptidase II
LWERGRERGKENMKKQLGIILAIILIDQLVKYAVRMLLFVGQTVVILPFFQLTHITNTGVAFGMFQGANLVFTIFTILILSGFIFWYSKNKGAMSGWLNWAVILIIAGALGNLIDRLVLGHVVDFLEFHWAGHYFPAFNMADSCISVGGVMLLIAFIRMEKHVSNAV